MEFTADYFRKKTEEKIIPSDLFSSIEESSNNGFFYTYYKFASKDEDNIDNIISVLDKKGSSVVVFERESFLLPIEIKISW